MFLVCLQCPVCNPNHASWHDRTGDTCERYSDDWCTAEGEKGWKWLQYERAYNVTRSFDYYMARNFTARHCPQCGCVIVDNSTLLGNGGNQIFILSFILMNYSDSFFRKVTIVLIGMCLVL